MVKRLVFTTDEPHTTESPIITAEDTSFCYLDTGCDHSARRALVGDGCRDGAEGAGSE